MLGNERIVLDEDLEVMCSQNVSHPAGNMPAIWYVWFRADSDRIRQLCQSIFDKYYRYWHCHQGRHTSRGDKRSSILQSA